MPEITVRYAPERNHLAITCNEQTLTLTGSRNMLDCITEMLKQGKTRSLQSILTGECQEFMTKNVEPTANGDPWDEYYQAGQEEALDIPDLFPEHPKPTPPSQDEEALPLPNLEF